MLDPVRIRDMAERYTAAWCSRDAKSVAAFYSQSGSLRVNTGAPAMGRIAIAAVAQGFMTEFPDLELVMDDLLVEDERAFYHWTLTGTNAGPGRNSRKVRISGFEEWRMGPDGLIAASQGSFDSAEYQRQLNSTVGGSRG
ncbi:MAG: nuclear transport factor 2 family protein [Acidobacteriota bacterium]